MQTRAEEMRDENTGKAEAKARRIFNANLTLQDSPRKAVTATTARSRWQMAGDQLGAARLDGELVGRHIIRAKTSTAQVFESLFESLSFG